MPYFCFRQYDKDENYIQNDDIDYITIIEAENAEQANKIAHALGMEFPDSHKDLPKHPSEYRWLRVVDADGHDDDLVDGWLHPEAWMDEIGETLGLGNVFVYARPYTGRLETRLEDVTPDKVRTRVERLPESLTSLLIEQIS